MTERLDVLIEMRSEMDRLQAERDEVVAGWQRRADLLTDAQLLLRELVGLPDLWEKAGAISALLVRMREEDGLDVAGATE